MQFDSTGAKKIVQKNTENSKGRRSKYTKRKKKKRPVLIGFSNQTELFGDCDSPTHPPPQKQKQNKNNSTQTNKKTTTNKQIWSFYLGYFLASSIMIYRGVGVTTCTLKQQVGLAYVIFWLGDPSSLGPITPVITDLYDFSGGQDSSWDGWMLYLSRWTVQEGTAW